MNADLEVVGVALRGRTSPVPRGCSLRKGGLVIALSLPLVACDGGTSLKGHVRDAQGNQIANTTVTLTVEGRVVTRVTGEDGYYSIGTLHPPFRIAESLTAEKIGLIRYEKRFSSSDHLREVEIVMMPTSPDTKR